MCLGLPEIEETKMDVRGMCCKRYRLTQNLTQKGKHPGRTNEPDGMRMEQFPDTTASKGAADHGVDAFHHNGLQNFVVCVMEEIQIKQKCQP